MGTICSNVDLLDHQVYWTGDKEVARPTVQVVAGKGKGVIKEELNEDSSDDDAPLFLVQEVSPKMKKAKEAITYYYQNRVQPKLNEKLKGSDTMHIELLVADLLKDHTKLGYLYFRTKAIAIQSTADKIELQKVEGQVKDKDISLGEVNKKLKISRSCKNR
uniref:Uncharacterized protein n=1 Tax=Cannabis sativa TaxID=3483 RepID=A0A803Q9N7_CANSA